MIPALEAVRRVLLRDWDPIGVHDIPGAQDEYDAYALQIFTMLQGNASEEDVAGYLNWAQGEHMGLPLTADGNRAIAARLVGLRKPS